MYGSRRGHGQRVGIGVAGAAVGALLLVAGCSSASSGGRDKPDRDERPVQRPKATAPYWVNPDSTAAKEAAKLRADGEKSDAALIDKIAAQPVAEWIGVDDPEGQARGFTEAAEKAGREALLVLYNIPHRDCGQYSQGGAADGNAYRDWLDKAVRGIGDRRATVVLEPDALPHIGDGCTPAQFHEERFALLKEAVDKLKALPATKVYLDAGNPNWVTPPDRMVDPLRRAGMDAADGFALNISNFQTTEANKEYGDQLSGLLGGKHYVIDTSRNGNGPLAGADHEKTWCNPAGRALGEPPTVKTGDPRVDAYLWIKRPGESDGTCKGGPGAGTWWEKYALELARNAR
ncbi:glycoside hydrolase family 6 protein [Streptomyces varsoviensis]|uniref:glycoside hydrolase family 6 protein n=1 Tax=Streptomyces varsoviensis TaxID=67373 RepID=UPI0033EC7EAE